jgi:hypothetical protein
MPMGGFRTLSLKMEGLGAREVNSTALFIGVYEGISVSLYFLCSASQF